jgi:hypothetical protein
MTQFRAIGVWLALWITSVAIGMGLLLRYQFDEGAASSPLERFPDVADVKLVPGRHTIVMVAHPRCTCTRASISELSWLMTRLQGLVGAYVLFIRPDGFEADWERTDLYDHASSLEGVEVVIDEGGAIASRFGAQTSGQTYLFDPAGGLVFEGGITPGRAHVGENVGRNRIVTLVVDGTADRDRGAVYGCPLSDEPSLELEKTQ